MPTEQDTWPELEAVKKLNQQQAAEALQSDRYKNVSYPPLGGYSKTNRNIHYSSIPSQDGDGNLTDLGMRQIEKGELYEIARISPAPNSLLTTEQRRALRQRIIDSAGSDTKQSQSIPFPCLKNNRQLRTDFGNSPGETQAIHLGHIYIAHNQLNRLRITLNGVELLFTVFCFNDMKTRLR